MKISLEWLGDYVTLPEGLEPKTIAHDLTMTTVEVEGLHDTAADLAGIVVARVQAISPHPDHDRARIVDCDAGDADAVRVVCGADNPAVGMLVALALPGTHARLRGERREVVVTSIKGVESHGMICAASELGLAGLFPDEGERDIIDLSAFEAKPGDAVADVLQLNDTVLEIDNKSLTNRPDLFGHHGIARELAAIYDVALAPLPTWSPPAGVAPVAVEIENRERCTRYVAVRIEGVTVEPAPFAMRSRLHRVGQRPINFIVDLSNYAMLAVGQPNHTFSADRLQLPIRIRDARPGDRMRLIDDSTVDLAESDLVIADDTTPVALAGVMGGGDSAVTDSTRELILEYATFEPTGIRRTSGSKQARSESSTRFEKGLDPYLIDAGLGFFMQVLASVQPGARVTGTSDVHPEPPQPHRIELTQEHINRKLGMALTPSQSGALLGRLGFETEVEGDLLRVQVPSWRSTGDVTAPEDIVEEVARLYGYEELPYSAPTVELTRAVSQPRVRMERSLREYLAFTAGMQEIASYPWVEDRYLEAAGNQRPTLSLHAAPAPSTSRLQPSLVPQLLRAAVENLRYHTEFRIFEVATVFRDESWTTPSHEQERLPSQPKLVAGMLVGANAKDLLLTAKGILQAMSRQVQMEPIVLEPGGEATWAEEGAQLRVLRDGQQVGELGLASARTRRLAQMKSAHAAVFELELDALRPLASRDNRYARLPTYPQSSFDISMVFPDAVTWSEIVALAGSAHPLVGSVSFVDEYIGKQVEAGHRSLTLRLVIGAPERTLKSEEIQEAGNVVIAGLAERFGGQLRG